MTSNNENQENKKSRIKKNDDEKLAQIREQMAQLKAREQKIINKQTSKKNHVKIVIGVNFLGMLKEMAVANHKNALFMVKSMIEYAKHINSKDLDLIVDTLEEIIKSTPPSE